MKKKREKRPSYLCAAVGAGIGTMFCPATRRPNGSMPNATPVFWSLSLSSYAHHMTDATQGAGPSVVDGGVVVVVVVPVVIVWSSPSSPCRHPCLLPRPRHHRRRLILVLPVVLVVPSSSSLTPSSFSTGQYPCLIRSPAVVPALIVLVVLSLLSPPRCLLTRPLTRPGPRRCRLLLRQASPSTLRAVARSGSWGCCGGGGVVGRGLVVSASSCRCNTVRSPRLM
jgi:hypothetical protein